MFWSWDVSQAGSKFSGLVEFHIRILHSLPGGSDGKESACNAGDLGSILGSGRSPGEGNGNPLQYSCLENPMERESDGGRSLVGYSPWGRKESDMTERLHFIIDTESSDRPEVDVCREMKSMGHKRRTNRQLET